MPEGVVDGGQAVDAGHESGRMRQSARQRPEGVPLDWVWDRKTRRWREPKRPGPKPGGADGGADPDGAEGDGAEPGGAGWQADRDPGAAHLSGDGGDVGGRPRPEVTDEVKDDVAGLLALLAVPVGALAERKDPYCGGVLADRLPKIVDAAVPLVCRSERVVRWMTADTGGLMDWIGLARALAPVGAAVVKHHVVKTVEVAEDPETGKPVVVEVDLSAYPAA